MNTKQNNMTAANQDYAFELDLVSRELPPGDFTLESLPNEYTYVRPATAGSLSTFSSGGCSSFGTIGSASTLGS